MSETGDPVIVIDHTTQNDYHLHQRCLNGHRLDDGATNIKFMVDDVEIPAHRPVIEILKNKRQLVREAIEKDRRMAKKENAEEATVFQLSGTTPNGFRKLLEYIYSGKVECDLSTSIELATTAYKLKFHPLVASLAQHLNHYRQQCLSVDTVDDLFHIGKISDNTELKKVCAKFLDERAYDIKNRFLKRDRQPQDTPHDLVYAFDKSRYCNYIHFNIPEDVDICFNLSVSSDRANWTVVLKNDEIWSRFWNWVYFEEKRVKYIKITFTDLMNGASFNIDDITDDYFLAKRANIELKFDPSTGYLIPKHDVSKFPIRDTRYFFGDPKLKIFTYCMSDSLMKEKEKQYYYHLIGDKNYLEFYLSQTCLVDNFRFRLWDMDPDMGMPKPRSYDFKVEVKSEDEEDYELVKDGNQPLFKNKSSWQTVRLPARRPVRWVRITGLKGPAHDPEFAIVDFQCPAQTHS